MMKSFLLAALLCGAGCGGGATEVESPETYNAEAGSSGDPSVPGAQGNQASADDGYDSYDDASGSRAEHEDDDAERDQGVDWGGASTPPPPPPSEPRIVPSAALETQRIAGNRAIGPGQAVKTAMKADGRARLVATVKMCIDSRGAVEKLTMLHASGYASYDSKLLASMKSWRYKPFRVNGRFVPVCTSFTFVYNQSL